MPSTSWTVKLLQDSPRLHVLTNGDGIYTVSSADDVPLYDHRDARYLAPSDPLYTSQSTYWRCFLRHRSSGKLVTEYRRHEDAESAIGMTIFRESDRMLKTGLEYIPGGYGPPRYRLKWIDGQMLIFEGTSSAPNTNPRDKGSLRCSDISGLTFAWLTRDRMRGDDMHMKTLPSATIWFEEDGIRSDLVDVIVSGFLAITDVQYPITNLE